MNLNKINNLNLIHPDLLAVETLVYNPSQFKYSLPIKEKESTEYGAYELQINNFSVRFRVAKITPTKIGQFVTLWKRIGNSPIQPYDMSDSVDFFVVSTRKDNYFGQFVFPKIILGEKNIVSKNGKGGKRGIRVYPPWDKTISPQAQQTQKWQLDYFLEIPENQMIDCSKAKRLYDLGNPDLFFQNVRTPF